VRRQDQLRTLETEQRSYRLVDYKRKTELIIIVFGSIFGFAVLIVLLAYISSVSQH
jgi:hypothetical protein